MKINPPINSLIGERPKVGIRPTLDGCLGGVRESPEKTTMTMAEIIFSTLRHSNGLPSECVTVPQRVLSCLRALCQSVSGWPRLLRNE